MKSTIYLSAILALLFFTSCEKETPAIVEEDLKGFDVQPELEPDGLSTDLSKIEHWGRVNEHGELIEVEAPDLDNPNSRSTGSPFLTLDWDHHPNTTWKLFYKDATGYTTGIGPTSGSWSIFLPLPNQVSCPSAHNRADYKLYIYDGPSCQLVNIGFSTSSCGNIDTDAMYFGKGSTPVNYFKSIRAAFSCGSTEGAVSYRSCAGNGDDCD